MAQIKENLKVKNVLVTGAYGGMGRATVEALAARGVRVFALDKRVGDPCENIIPIQADLTSEAEVAVALDKVREHTDSLSAIVHFAGIYMLDSLVELEAADFRRILDVNLYGAYLINRAAMPLLQAGSRIIITTSELAPLDPLHSLLIRRSYLCSLAIAAYLSQRASLRRLIRCPLRGYTQSVRQHSIRLLLT